jgi:hypothetical protein
MVIFGAGASYDSISSRPPELHLRKTPEGMTRPPLAFELFTDNDFFRGRVARFPRCRSLLAELEPRPGRECPSVEEILEGIRATADDTDLKELCSVQYYLRDLIRDCQQDWIQRWHGATNYHALLRQVRKYGPACFVTFNYDTMFEAALGDHGVQIKGINDCYGIQLPLFKLHGSIDWELLVEVPREWNRDLGEQEMIDFAPSHRHSEFFRKAGEPGIPNVSQRLSAWIPAIAIPMASKAQFVCPPTHVVALAQQIPQVDKILIVGWKAAEQSFLKLLCPHLRRSVDVLAVCKDANEGNETLEKLKAAGLQINGVADPGGFSSFVANNRVQPFLASSGTVPAA